MTQAEINKQINREKYYIIRSKTLADALWYITGKRPYKFDDIDNKRRKIYSFEYSERFEMVLTKLNELRKKYYHDNPLRAYSREEYTEEARNDARFKFYELRNKKLANAVQFITNDKYFTYNNFNVDKDVNKKIYEFKNTNYLHEVLDAIEELKEEYKNYYKKN